MSDNGLTGDIDLLSLDIDGNDDFLRNDVGPDIPAVETATVHPDPAMDTQPLFDRLAEGGLQIVDLESRKE